MTDNGSDSMQQVSMAAERALRISDLSSTEQSNLSSHHPDEQVVLILNEVFPTTEQNQQNEQEDEMGLKIEKGLISIKFKPPRLAYSIVSLVVFVAICGILTYLVAPTHVFNQRFSADGKSPEATKSVQADRSGEIKVEIVSNGQDSESLALMVMQVVDPAPTWAGGFGADGIVLRDVAPGIYRVWLIDGKITSDESFEISTLFGPIEGKRVYIPDNENASKMTEEDIEKWSSVSFDLMKEQTLTKGE